MIKHVTKESYGKFFPVRAMNVFGGNRSAVPVIPKFDLRGICMV